jgi:murein DD-endopeptidase MepM/ murein hydrolase activator NlpD
MSQDNGLMSKINSYAQSLVAFPAILSMNFPLSFVPAQSYKSWTLGFGAKRPAMGEQLHGACDLLAPIGTEVFAVDEGTVIAGPYHFYLGAYAIDVKHRFFVVRYGEIKKDALVKAGDHIEKGQVIGHVGKVGRGSMLHFEMFSGKASGNLTTNKLPYKRRSDLMNPTPFLDVWQSNLPIKS